MSLSFEDDPTHNNNYGGKNKDYCAFSDSFYHDIRDQPVKVKISKQMKERYKSYEAEVKAQSDRSNHLLTVDKRGKDSNFTIGELRPKYFQRIKASHKPIEELTIDT